MRSTNRRTKRGYGRLLYPPGPTVVSLLFSAIIWLGLVSSAQAIDPLPPDGGSWALYFDGAKDFAFFRQDFVTSQFTLMMYIEPDFSRTNSSDAALLRFNYIDPASGGDIELGQNVAMWFQLKRHPEKVAVMVCTSPTKCESATSDMMLQEGPQFIAVTFDGKDATFYQYQDGKRLNKDKKAIFDQFITMPIATHTIIGRAVSSYKGKIEWLFISKKALPEEDIKAAYSCGPSITEDTFVYLPIDVKDSQILYDRSGNENHAQLGESADPNDSKDRADPTYTEGKYSVAQEDNDHDGVPDLCDNCLGFSNPLQKDFDFDGVGDFCDSCPQVPNGPKLGTCVYYNTNGAVADVGDTCLSDAECQDQPGGLCSQKQEDVADLDLLGDVCDTDFIGEVEADGTNAKVTLNYSGTAPIDVIDPTCFNVTFTCVKLNCLKEGNPEEDCIIPPVDQTPPGYWIRYKDKYGDNKGNVITIYPGDTKDLECSLLDNYMEKDLAAAGPIECSVVFANYLQHEDVDPVSGECPADEEIEDCIKLWTGAFKTITDLHVQQVDINLKPTSYPNIINCSGGGVLPTVIYTTDDFDAATVDVSKLSFEGNISKNPKGSECLNSTSLVDIGETQLADGTWVGDGDLDLLLHWREDCIEIKACDTQGIMKGKTYPDSDGKIFSFEGRDEITPFKCRACF